PAPTDMSKTFTSQKNAFGLTRIYRGKELPKHDPEETVALVDLSDIPRSDALQVPTLGAHPSLPSPYFPYPNKNSFALGKWYWSSGTQKSQRSFKELVDIVGADDFQPKDIQSTQWSAIDKTLGQSEFDNSNDRHEWEDEDAGWKRTPISLDIPFSKNMK
ncbi:hypothetical protein DXG01_015883, partial [Tephrocybe rancida]